MYTKDETWCVIPARGGSKGLKMKNTFPLNGKPLISYTIDSAKNCQEIDRVIVSTDNEDIRDTSLQYGALVPSLRPKEISNDTALISDAYWHGVDSAVEKLSIIPKKIIVLYPTSPFRPSYIIREAIRELDFSIVYKVCQQIQHQRGYYIHNDSNLMQHVYTGGGLKQMGLVFGIRYFPPDCRPYPKTYQAFLMHLQTMEFVGGGTSVRILDTDFQPWEIDIDTAEDIELANWCIKNGLYDIKNT